MSSKLPAVTGKEVAQVAKGLGFWSSALKREEPKPPATSTESRTLTGTMSGCVLFASLQSSSLVAAFRSDAANFPDSGPV